MDRPARGLSGTSRLRESAGQEIARWLTTNSSAPPSPAQGSSPVGVADLRAAWRRATRGYASGQPARPRRCILHQLAADADADDFGLCTHLLVDELDKWAIPSGIGGVGGLCSQQKLWFATVRKGRRQRPRTGVDDLVQRDFTVQWRNRLVTEHHRAPVRLNSASRCHLLLLDAMTAGSCRAAR